MFSAARIDESIRILAEIGGKIGGGGELGMVAHLKRIDQGRPVRIARGRSLEERGRGPSLLAEIPAQSEESPAKRETED